MKRTTIELPTLAQLVRQAFEIEGDRSTPPLSRCANAERVPGLGFCASQISSGGQNLASDFGRLGARIKKTATPSYRRSKRHGVCIRS